MLSLPRRQPHEKLRDPGLNPGKPQLRDEGDMRFEVSFTARVQEQVMQGKPSHEFQKIVALKQSNLASFVVLRRTSKLDAKKTSASSTQYPVQRCVKVTPWKDVERQCTMAIQFEKDDPEMADRQKQMQLGNVSNVKVQRDFRTKVSTVTIRHWPLEAAEEVKQFWTELYHAAKEREGARPTKRRRESGTGRQSVVDLKFRMRERQRFADSFNAHKAGARPSIRLSQGQKMQQALKRGTPQKGGKYSALARGATGEQSFAKSLVGSPDLKAFGERPKKMRAVDGSANGRTIEKELDKRCHIPGRKRTSVFSTELDYDLGEGGCTDSPTSEEEPSRVLDSSADDREIYRKRRPSSLNSPEERESRKRYLADSLARHRKSTADTTPSRRDVQSGPASNTQCRAIAPVASVSKRAGILNEGNTCYLAAVVQALMCDQDMIARLRDRTGQNSLHMPFSSALVSMANDRQCSTPLRAVEIRKAISRHFPQFSSSDQQDAHEFFLRCLDVISMECTWTDFWVSPAHSDYSAVQEQKVTCTSCGHSSDPRREILRGLSLDIPLDSEDTDSTLSLQDLLQRFFESEELELNCEHCDGTKAKSHTEIILPPRALVLHIKRFAVDHDRSRGRVSLRKITIAARVPERISLSPYLADDAQILEPTIGSISDTANDAEKTRKVTPSRIDEDVDLFSDPGSPPPGLASPAPLRSQAFSQMTQVASPEQPTGSSRTPYCVSITRAPTVSKRFRVHGEEDEVGGTCGPELHPKPIRRTLQLDDDAIEDYATEAAFAGGTGAEDERIVKSVMGLGLHRADAEEVAKKANYDNTRAAGLAMDKLQELRERHGDLDEALVKHTWSQSAVQSSQRKRPRGEYKLAAVIRHESDSIESGHYVVDLLQSDGSWVCYNDSRVSELRSRRKQDLEGYLCWYIQDDS